MDKIASFQVDHNILQRGVYLSRDEFGIQTWDVRMRRPYYEPIITNDQAHSLEHLWATYFRNVYPNETVYVGPMGCLTGFYIITRNLTYKEVLEALYNATRYVLQESERDNEIPGNSEIECGYCYNLSMGAARLLARDFYPTIDELYNNFRKLNQKYPTTEPGMCYNELLGYWEEVSQLEKIAKIPEVHIEVVPNVTIQGEDALKDVWVRNSSNFFKINRDE